MLHIDSDKIMPNSPHPQRINIGFIAALTLAFSFLFTQPLVLADSQAGSKLLASELEQQLAFGEIVWLEQGNQSFLSIFTPDLTASPQGGAIILPDANGHPDWPDVVQPLQQTLPHHHWATLSISLPPLRDKGELRDHMPDIKNRIDAAVRELIDKGLNNIVIIGYGTGATAAACYLAEQQQANISAFVAVSLSVDRTEKGEDYLPLKLEKITMPLLDIFASGDQPEVTQTAQIRSVSARKSSSNIAYKQAIESFQRSALATEPGNKIQGYIAYRQVMIPGTNHTYRGAEPLLTKRILGWLMRHAKGVSIVNK